MTDTSQKTDVRNHWSARLAEWLPGFLDAHPVLSRFHRSGSVVLYGSTMLGVDDAFSDIDLWLLLSKGDLAGLDAVSETRFFTFKVDGKAGHVVAHTADELRRRLEGCDMDTVYHLRNAEILTDDLGAAAGLIEAARRPMRQEVADAFFFYHYVEMRSDHRACDNPMDRTDPIALLMFLPKTIAHALRAAIVLDGEPYPYEKWLYQAACKTPTGRRLAPTVEAVIDLLGEDQLRYPGPECDHPIGRELMTLRRTLIDAAHAHGNHAPWLNEWWLHMNQARDAIQGVRWSGPSDL